MKQNIQSSQKIHRSTLDQLVLVNWRGVFYQEYDLDTLITSLTGLNGAGKTTVMAGAYVAMLPDQSLLDFRQGQSSAGNSKKGGLWGRFGDGSVSYSAISYVDATGMRIIAGVQVRKKAEPDFELIPFVIESLPIDAIISELFLDDFDGTTILVDSDQNSGMKSLDKKLKPVGAKLRTFKGRIGEYMGCLFEHHITPLRFAKSNERRKFNKLLQTSLFGGLSSEIQQSLKDYLLDKDQTISSQVQRAESNLDACRKTKSALQRTANQREFIQSVFEESANLTALYLSELFVGKKEAFDKALQARRAWLENKQQQQLLEAKLVASQKQNEKIKEELNLYGEALEEATKNKESLKELERLYTNSKLLQERISEQKVLTKTSESSFIKIQLSLESAKKRDSEIERQYDELLTQFLNHDQAIEVEARKASLYKAAIKAKTEVEQLLDTSIDPAQFPTLLSKSESCIQELRSNIAALDRKVALQEANSKNKETALIWLERILSHSQFSFLNPEKPQTNLPEVTSKILSHWHEQESSLKQLSAIHRQAEQLAEGKRRRSDLLRFIKYELEQDCLCSEEFHNSFHKTQQDISELQSHIDQSKEDLGDLKEDLEDQKHHISQIEARVPHHQRALFLLDKVKNAGFQSPKSENELVKLRSDVRSRKLATEQSKLKYLAKREATHQTIEDLQQCRVFKDERLVELAASIGGDLVADIFESVSIQEAGETEAKLGFLRDAIHVSDPETALQELLAIEDRPDHVYLTNARKVIFDGEFERHQDSVISRNNSFIRVSKHPQHPVIGSDAREKELERLEKARDRLDKKILEVEMEIRQFEEAESHAIELSHIAGYLFEEKDIELAKEEAEESLKTTRNRKSELESTIAGLEESLQRNSKLLSNMRDQIPYANLLDDNSLEDDFRSTQDKLSKLESFGEAMAEIAPWIKELERSASSLLDVEEDDFKSHLTEAEKRITHESDLLGLLKKAHELSDYLQYQESAARISENQNFAPELLVEREKLEQRKQAAREVLREEQESFNSQQADYLSHKSQLDRLEEEYDFEKKKMEGLGGSKRLADIVTTDKQIASLKEKTASKEQLKNDTYVTFRELEGDLEKNYQLEKKLLSSYRKNRSTWKPFHDYANMAKLSSAYKSKRIQDLITKFSLLKTNQRTAKANTAALTLNTLLQKEKGAFLSAKSCLASILDPDVSNVYLQACKAYEDIFDELSTHLPRDIVQSEDPMNALNEMVYYCDKLQIQLSQQERSLATSTFDVGQAIDQKIRKEFRNISKLNEGLDQVKFGSIRAIRIRYGKKAGMDEILKALKAEGDNQQRLFEETSEHSFADILEMIYQQKIGKKFSGDSLLDYRYYMELTVQVRRVGSEQWESVDANRLSTGESIGVGISVLIMVLQSWEQQTYRLLGIPRKSCRFLFLDEASRLDSSSINTLGVLCDQMQLQLLIAAPSADKAIVGTTYCLNRVVDGEGREQVIVRGVRGFQHRYEDSPESLKPEIEAIPVEILPPEQPQLF